MESFRLNGETNSPIDWPNGLVSPRRVARVKGKSVPLEVYEVRALRAPTA